MNRNTIGIILCAAVVVLVLVVFLLIRGSDGDNKKESVIPQKAEDYAQIGDSNLAKVKTDSKDSDKPWQEMKDEEYSLDISVIDGGWTGDYMEDGSDEKVKKVLALKFTNNSSQDIQYAEYVYGINSDPVSFKLSDLPAGQSCIVLEAGRHEFKKKEALSLVSRVVAQVDEIPFAREDILVVDNSDNSISVMNLTDKEIPVARVFYKTFDSEENLFVGGITYTAKVEKIPAGGGITVTPSHFVSGDSVVVGTGIYESE